MTNRSKRQTLDVWNTVPWLAAHRIGGHHRRMVDGAEKVQHPTAHAWPEDRARSVTPTDAHEPNGGED
jgi:hypothetical protein